MASITVATFQDCIEQGYIIRAFCIPCQRCVLIDLHALAQARHSGAEPRARRGDLPEQPDEHLQRVQCRDAVRI